MFFDFELMLVLLATEHGCKEFRCKQREFCVSADLMCDGVDHCADGSDEDTAALCPGKADHPMEFNAPWS